MGEDFNDLAVKSGAGGKPNLALVKKQVDAAVDSAKGIPFGQFLIKPKGVYLIKKDDEEPLFFCSPIKPVGLARTVRGESFSIVFEMVNPDVGGKTLLLPLEALQAAGGEAARIMFARLGGYFGQGIRTRQAFADFCNAIMAKSKNLPRVTLVTQSGWLRLNDSYHFVLADKVFGGDSSEKVILQSPEAVRRDFAVKGTLQEWQEKIGKYSICNSRMLLAVSVAFAGPLLELLNCESGGLHIVGLSSLGKSTLVKVAASVMGEQQAMIKPMNATASAFETDAALANDGTLLLDELGLAPPEQIGGVIYKLSNGVGRGRADSYGNGKERRSWRILFMTSGETDLESMMRSAGKRTYAGQVLRHANIQADTGCHGVFEHLHGFKNGAELTEHLLQEVLNCFGTPFRMFLEKLVDERKRQPVKLQERLHEIMSRFKSRAVPEGADGQVTRVASRFALIAAAGELGTEYGVTGWPVSEAFDGALVCFRVWLDRRGTFGKVEEETLVQQVETFLELHGEARFTPMEGEVKGPARTVLNRAGFRRVALSTVSGVTANEYFVLPSAFQEMVTGFDQRWAAVILAERGLLRVGKEKTSVSMNLPGMGKQRCYHFPARNEGEEKNFETQ